MPKILGGRLPGKIGLCRHKVPDFYRGLKHSSIAQLVEHAAVNRRVVGSSPTWGAKNTEYTFVCSVFFILSMDSNHDKLLQICLQIWEKQSGGLFRSRLHSLWWLIFTVINGDIVGRCWHRPYIFMFFIEHDYKKAGGSYPPLRVQEQFIGGVPQESPL